MFFTLIKSSFNFYNIHCSFISTADSCKVRRKSIWHCLTVSSNCAAAIALINTFPLSGEIFELKAELNNEKKEKRKEAVKKVIAAMTVGKDVRYSIQFKLTITNNINKQFEVV